MRDLDVELREYIDALVAPLSVDDLRDRAAVGRRRTRRRGVALAAAAVVVVSLVAAVLVRNADKDDVAVVVHPTPSGRVVVGSDRGRLGLYDLGTGELLRQLTDEEPGGGAASPSATGDGRFIYFDRGLGSCASAIDRLDTQTGTVSRVAVQGDGSPPVGSPSVSTDGRHLAYIVGSCGETETQSVALSNGSDTTRTFLVGTSTPPAVAGRIAVAPDGTHLAYLLLGGGGIAYGIGILDADTATSALDVKPLALDGCPRQVAPAYRPDGSLLAVTCEGGDQNRIVVAAFDPKTGERLGTVFALPDVHDPMRTRRLDVSADGNAVLYEGEDGTFVWESGALRRVTLPAGVTDLAFVGSPEQSTTPSTTEAVPPGASIGPRLDPDHLEGIPDTGVALQIEGTTIVVLVATDGTVLGHLDGFTLYPKPWPNAPLLGAGPLVLGRGPTALTLDGDRLVTVPGAPGAIPLADGAVLVPHDRDGSEIRLRDRTLHRLPFGELTVSSDRQWVTVREPNADGTSYGNTTAWWLGNGEATQVDLDDGCIAATDTGRVPVLLCDDQIRIDDVTIHDGGPFGRPDAGHWTAAQLSDDSRSLLLQHSGECESQSAWRLSLDDPAAQPIALGPTDQAWDSGGLGWLPDGRVVASFGPGVCGTALPDGPGVYTEDESGAVTLVYPTPAGTTYLGALLWRQTGA